MNVETIIKPAFFVMGKEGSTDMGADFVSALWLAANRDFSAVEPFAKRDENGKIAGYWGAMTDVSRSFRPWEDEFSRGLYLAGVECVPDAEPPEGWAKWRVPGFRYLRVRNAEGVFAETLRYLAVHGLPLAGAVQDYTDPITAVDYMLFPVERLDE